MSSPKMIGSRIGKAGDEGASKGPIFRFPGNEGGTFGNEERRSNTGRSYKARNHGG